MGQMVCLASASPRRRELLNQLGIVCDVRPAVVDEAPHAGEAPAEHVLRVAAAKARTVAASADDPELLVLAADTTVVREGDILGKPRDRTDALAMLARLAGVSHEVYTGVALVCGERCATALSRSRVWFRPIPPAEAEAYWATGEPADKAGGYAIQGLGAVFVERLEGSYSGVMGLPLFESARLLKAFGYRVFGRQI